MRQLILLGCCSGPSEPISNRITTALVIAQPLVVKHEFSDLAGKLRTLPQTFHATSLFTLFFRGHRACGPDRVGCCAQFVGCDMSHRDGLTGGMSRFLRGAEYLSCRSVSGKGGNAGLSHRNSTPSPSAREFNRSGRTVVTGFRLFEQAQHVLRAIGRLLCKQAMIGVLKGAAATHGDKPTAVFT
jgi:hypothetical protein